MAILVGIGEENGDVKI